MDDGSRILLVTLESPGSKVRCTSLVGTTNLLGEDLLLRLICYVLLWTILLTPVLVALVVCFSEL